jgi:hypothetical protein
LPASARARASVAAAEAAAVRIAVTSPAWITAAGAPVWGSKIATSPWCDWPPSARFSGKMLISLAPNSRPAPMAPGITPNRWPSSRSIMLRSVWRVCPADSAIIASRTSGMTTSQVSPARTASRPITIMRHAQGHRRLDRTAEGSRFSLWSRPFVVLRLIQLKRRMV